MTNDLTPAEAESYIRNHVDRKATVVATSVVARFLVGIDRDRVRLRELEAAIEGRGPIPAPRHEPQPEHYPLKARDACIVPLCRCTAAQAVTTT